MCASLTVAPAGQFEQRPGVGDRSRRCSGLDNACQERGVLLASSSSFGIVAAIASSCCYGTLTDFSSSTRTSYQTTSEITCGTPSASPAIIGREALLRLVGWCRHRHANATPGGAPCSDAPAPTSPPTPIIPSTLAEPALGGSPSRASTEGASGPRSPRNSTARTGARRKGGDR